MFEYPFKVSYYHMAGQRFDNQARLAEWCVKNLGRNDWLHDRWSFEFRKHEDYLQFLLTWT